MMLSEVLRAAYEKFREPRFWLRLSDTASIMLYPQLLDEAAGGDLDLAHEALLALDASSPGGLFGYYCDGGVISSVKHERHYNRRPVEVAAVLGKALARALAAEA